MLNFRPFRNADPPAIAALWRRCSESRAMLGNASPDLLEQFAFCKPYFENEGLIVAEDGGELAGLVHVGFGPSEDGADLDTDAGVICMLLCSPEAATPELYKQLIEQAEAYSLKKGAKAIYAGSAPPRTPFYLGIHGGSNLAGLTSRDDDAIEALQAVGYVESDRIEIWQLRTHGFRPPIDRAMMQIRRAHKVTTELEPSIENWWQACTIGQLDRFAIHLVPLRGGEPTATAVLWNMEPGASSRGVRSAGVLSLVSQGETADAAGAFLLAEAIKQTQTNGVALVEAQTFDREELQAAILKKLGFSSSDVGFVLHKRL